MSNIISLRKWSSTVRYAIALVAVTLALFCRQAMNPTLGDASPFMYFFVAIIVSGWLGGLGPGLLATVLSTMVVDYFYLRPIGWVMRGGAKELEGTILGQNFLWRKWWVKKEVKSALYKNLESTWHFFRTEAFLKIFQY